jgi:hypothetical protein
MEFINQGWFNARIVVDTYKPDPNYAAAAFPGGVAVAFAPPAGPSPSRYLLLPVGAYTFCYDWQDGAMYHAITALTGLANSAPSDREGAYGVIITPGREARRFDGPCPNAPPVTSGAAGSPVPTRAATRTPTAQQIGSAPNTRTPTVTVSRAGAGVTPTATWTPTRTRPAAATVTPTARKAVQSPPPTRTPVDYVRYRDAWWKRIEDLRNEFIQKNCTPSYSGCAVDIKGMPTPARNSLYTYYSVNLHPSYLTFAQSLEDQLLVALRKCFQEFIDSKGKGNLDVRVGAQGKCIYDHVDVLWQKEWTRIHETSCRAACGEQGKIGVVEGSPRVCVCK